jgi:hypothetical protein
MIGYIYSYGLSLVSYSIVTRVLRLQSLMQLVSWCIMLCQVWYHQQLLSLIVGG